jgi:RNA polymerase sigma factor (sigma-70 family)
MTEGHGRGTTEAQWVHALQRREAWAWQRLHQQTLEPLFAYVYRHCHRREDAEDLTAEVYAAAAAGIDHFRGDASVITWLRGIARRKLVDAARRRRSRPELLESDLPAPAAEMATGRASGEPVVSESPQALLEQREAATQLYRLVFALPEAQREALLLRCVDQLALAEIAHVLGRTEKAVKGLLQRAKAAVLERLNAEACDNPTNAPEEPHHAGPLPSSACETAPPPAD